MPQTETPGTGNNEPGRLTDNTAQDEFPDWQPVPTCTKKGTNGSDSLQGGLQNDTLNGGTGTDTASYASSATGEGSDMLSFIERLTDTSTKPDFNAANYAQRTGRIGHAGRRGRHRQRYVPVRYARLNRP